MVTDKRHVSNFHSLSASNNLDVYITQDQEESLRLEIDENLLEHIITEVRNGELRIASDVNIRMAKSKKVYLSYKDLSSIKISSAGNVQGENKMNAGKLDIELSSAGDLNLDIEAEEINIGISSSGNAHLSGKTGYLNADLSSAGDLNAFDLVADKGDVSVSSAGDARVNITGDARFTSSSAGDIIYTGDPKIIDIHTSSAGSVRRK